MASPKHLRGATKLSKWCATAWALLAAASLVMLMRQLSVTGLPGSDSELKRRSLLGGLLPSRHEQVKQNYRQQHSQELEIQPGLLQCSGALTPETQSLIVAQQQQWKQEWQLLDAGATAGGGGSGPLFMANAVSRHKRCRAAPRGEGLPELHRLALLAPGEHNGGQEGEQQQGDTWVTEQRRRLLLHTQAQAGVQASTSGADAPAPQLGADVWIGGRDAAAGMGFKDAAAASEEDEDEAAAEEELLQQQQLPPLLASSGNGGADITLVTQLSIDRLPSLERQCRSWLGPIVAVAYAPLVGGQVAMLEEAGGQSEAATAHLKGSSPLEALAHVVDFHRRITAVQGICSLTLELVVEERCNAHLAGLWPINANRNRALMLARTPVVALVDVDFLVAGNLSPWLRPPSHAGMASAAGGGSGAADKVAGMADFLAAGKAAGLPLVVAGAAGGSGTTVADFMAAGAAAEAESEEARDAEAVGGAATLNGMSPAGMAVHAAADDAGQPAASAVEAAVGAVGSAEDAAGQAAAGLAAAGAGLPASAAKDAASADAAATQAGMPVPGAAAEAVRAGTARVGFATAGLQAAGAMADAAHSQASDAAAAAAAAQAVDVAAVNGGAAAAGVEAAVVAAAAGAGPKVSSVDAAGVAAEAAGAGAAGSSTTAAESTVGGPAAGAAAAAVSGAAAASRRLMSAGPGRQAGQHAAAGAAVWQGDSRNDAWLASLLATAHQDGRSWLEAVLSQNAAVVLPAFQANATTSSGGQDVDREMEIALRAAGGSKEEAAELAHAGDIAGFQLTAYPRGHKATRYWWWLQAQVPYAVDYWQGYEPFLLMPTALTPFYDERFRGYGWDKHAHTLHAVRQLDMRLVVHPDAWLVHTPHKHSAAQSTSRTTGQRVVLHDLFLDLRRRILNRRYVPSTAFYKMCLTHAQANQSRVAGGAEGGTTTMAAAAAERTPIAVAAAALELAAGAAGSASTQPQQQMEAAVAPRAAAVQAVQQQPAATTAGVQQQPAGAAAAATTDTPAGHAHQQPQPTQQQHVSPPAKRESALQRAARLAPPKKVKMLTEDINSWAAVQKQAMVEIVLREEAAQQRR